MLQQGEICVFMVPVNRVSCDLYPLRYRLESLSIVFGYDVAAIFNNQSVQGPYAKVEIELAHRL